MELDHIMDVTTVNKIPFRVVYGYREYFDGSHSKERVVSFYDRRYTFTMHGQFVSDYNYITVVTSDMASHLNLYGGEVDWMIDRENMKLIREWLLSLSWLL